MRAEEVEATRKAFGRVLKRLRKQAGLSQEALAERTGLHRTTLSLFEVGAKCPTIISLCDLAKGLGVSTGEIMLLFDREWVDAAEGVASTEEDHAATRDGRAGAKADRSPVGH